MGLGKNVTRCVAPCSNVTGEVLEGIRLALGFTFPLRRVCSAPEKLFRSLGGFMNAPRTSMRKVHQWRSIGFPMQLKILQRPIVFYCRLAFIHLRCKIQGCSATHRFRVEIATHFLRIKSLCTSSNVNYSSLVRHAHQQFKCINSLFIEKNRFKGVLNSKRSADYTSWSIGSVDTHRFIVTGLFRMRMITLIRQFQRTFGRFAVEIAWWVRSYI